MDMSPFRAPVRLHVDGKFVDIETLAEAEAFLRAWPASRCGPVYACALRGCEAARAGTMKLDDARKAFESFARITGILAPRRLAAATTNAEPTPPTTRPTLVRTAVLH